MDEVVAVSSPTGLSLIGRRMDEVVVDIYVTKMTLDPESGARFLSFSPLNALAEKQEMDWVDFFALANRGAHCGVYTPADSIIEAYLAFVDDEASKEMMAGYYTKETGPCAEYLAKIEAERAAQACSGTVKECKQEVKDDGKVISGIFGGAEE